MENLREDASDSNGIARVGGVIHIDRTVIGSHLVLHGYGHWLSNDPRGSGSTELRDGKFRELGPIHTRRKRTQPSREELRQFYREAEELLDHPTIWFDKRMRRVIADAFAEVVKKRGYTSWSCAVLQNHAHALIRVHRDSAEVMWENLAFASRDALRAEGFVPENHPVWSNRPYVVYKTSVPLVRKCIGYIQDNPTKHGLPRQTYPWVTAYDGFPHHKKSLNHKSP